METKFTYHEFITRNIGFVSMKEQEVLKNTTVFVPGVGGMGGAAVECLARAGVGSFILADIDYFEVSNLNRQIFSSLSTIGQDKVQVATSILKDINPDLIIEIRDGNWINELDEILQKADIVVNGCDDVKATLQMMRKCKEHGVYAIDAFASPLPNVYVIGPKDNRPEEVFGFPTVNLSIDQVDEKMEAECVRKEIEHVATNSNSLSYVDLDIASEIMNGTRKRISFAPMVWLTGCMMSYEVVRVLLNKKGGPGVKGMFYNPWTCRVEHPKGPIMSAIRKYFVRRFMKKL